RYPPVFNGQTREVYLNGEAFFDVFKDHQHPFIVHAGKMNVKVLGTAFNIKSYANESRSETTLIRGAIEVTMSDRPSDRIILKPNEKLILNNTTIQKRGVTGNLTAMRTDTVYSNYALTNLTHLKSNDTTVVETSWVNNKLIFKDQAFNEIANQMERWYGVKIAFRNESVKDYRFTGVFENESVIQALDALKLIENFNYKYKNETISIY
ncbi:MAG TPA: FecR domain-containing protein, partial [Mucilaginibacter sp.]|nr:FecR domain-containing protein [Mucilaginibacter sp.]